MDETNGNGTTTIASENTQTTEEPRDQFGRTASERTVELSPEDAESVNHEVEAGKHDSYDDALAHLIKSGIRENKRTRENLAKTKEARELRKTKEGYKKLMEQFPTLVADPEFVKKAFAEMMGKR